MQVTHDQLEAAGKLVYQHVKPTPFLCWPLLCEAVGAEVWVKHENHTPIGAFKVRGGLTYMNALAEAGGADAQGPIVTATRGNHGQSIPFAARLHGREVHVYVPENNSQEKNAAMVAWGAHLHIEGPDFDMAREAAERAASRLGAHAVPSFHAHIVQGVSTYAGEMFRDVADLDAVYVPIGMGSGACSVIAIRDLLGLSTKVIGVVAEGADAIARSFAAGRIVTTATANTFADGVATRVPHEEAFDILYRGLDRVVVVSDDEIADAVRLLYRCTHNIAEGAGAAATAALMQDVRTQARRNQDGTTPRCAVVLTGGNIDQDWVAQILTGTTPSV